MKTIMLVAACVWMLIGILDMGTGNEIEGLLAMVLSALFYIIHEMQDLKKDN